MKHPVLKAICCFVATFLFVVMPPLVGATYEVAIVAVFIWWFLLRPEERGAGRLDLGLRPIRGGVGWVAAAIAACLVFDVAIANAIARIAPHAIDRPWGLWGKYLAQPYGAIPPALSVVVVGPLIEEYVFRGWLQHAAARRMGDARAIVLSAAVFAIGHLAGLATTPIIFLLGLAAGVLVHRTRSLWAGIALHVCCNGIAAIGFLLSGDPNRVHPDLSTPLAVFVAAALAGALAFLAVLPRIRPAPDPMPVPASGATPALR